MFKIGDVVVYSATGVCKISDICEKSFGADVLQYYMLSPLMKKSSTVFVPINNEKLTQKMHHVLTENEFEETFAIANSQVFVRPDSESERRNKFTEILNSGNRALLIQMVLDLKLYKSQQIQNSRRLHLADERLLSCSQELLFEEIAYVFEIEQDSVQEFLKSKIPQYI